MRCSLTLQGESLESMMILALLLRNFLLHVHSLASMPVVDCGSVIVLDVPFTGC